MQSMDTVLEAIAAFKRAHPQYATQRGALYQCVDASYRFIGFLNTEYKMYGAKIFEFGIDEPERNPDPTIFKDGMNESNEYRAHGHCIVEIDGLLIDWTARQYVETAPFPYLIPKAAAMAAKAGAQ